jgi:hypothetical protein
MTHIGSYIPSGVSTEVLIDRWSKRFTAERLAGLFSRRAGQLPTTLTPTLEARILE